MKDNITSRSTFLRTLGRHLQVLVRLTATVSLKFVFVLFHVVQFSLSPRWQSRLVGPSYDFPTPPSSFSETLSKILVHEVSLINLYIVG